MSIAQFAYSGTELDALSEADNYYSAILRYFADHVGPRTIEVGAGIGTFATHLLQCTGLSHLVLVEPAENNIPTLRRRFAEDARVQVVHGYLEDHLGTLSADSVVAVNVLEHVEDDLTFLRAAHAVLALRGALLLFVPAFGQLHGTLDEAFGHFRRYTKSALRSKLSQAGFRVESIRYFNGPGVIPWWITGRVLRRRTLGSRAVRFYDRWMTPWVSRLERWWEPPIGQSIIVIAQKTNTTGVL